MHWHLREALALFHHMPHSLGDLLHHEDKALVKAGAAGIIAQPSGIRHSLILPDSGADAAPRIAIEKDIDPGVSRSEQNLGLLIQDYLHSLPEYSAHTMEGEALLQHWRKILLEQPQRLAEAHMDSWNNERSRLFWKERLSHQASHLDDQIIHPVDDWERSAGTLVPPTRILGLIDSRRWQDLVIRQRLHNLELRNTGHQK